MNQRAQSRYIDPRAPSTYEDLPESEKIALSNNSGIQRLEQTRDALAAETKELYGSITNAEGTKIGELKMKADATLRTTKKKLKESRFNDTREKFFALLTHWKSISGLTRHSWISNKMRTNQKGLCNASNNAVEWQN